MIIAEAIGRCCSSSHVDLSTGWWWGGCKRMEDEVNLTFSLLQGLLVIGEGRAAEV